MDLQWPDEGGQDLIIGDTRSCVAICTLWSERKALLRALQPHHFAACGNLYSLWGVNALLRNLLANPSLRYLVVCGIDRSGAGDALMALSQRGVDDEGRIVGTDVTIDSSIPRQAMESLRSRVEFVDIRGCVDPAVIAERVRSLAPRPPQGEPLQLEGAAPAPPQALASEEAAFLVRAASLEEAWLEATYLVLLLGEHDCGRRGVGAIHESPLPTCAFQLAGAVSTVATASPTPWTVAQWLPAAGWNLEEGAGPQGKGILDRCVQAIYPQLEARGTGGPHLCYIWPGKGEAGIPLALVASIHRSKVHLLGQSVAVDVFRDWIPAMLTLKTMQTELTCRMGCAPGALTLSCGLLVLREEDRGRAMELVHQHRREPAVGRRWTADPRGNLLIRVECRDIVVEHATAEGGRTGFRFEGRRAQRLYKTVLASGLVSSLEHAAYLGLELQRAETALRLSLPYKQDRPLPLLEGKR